MTMIPTGVKDPFERLPAGLLGFSLGRGFEEFIQVQGRDTLTWVVPMVVVCPEGSRYVGQEHNERFFIGSPEDPEGQQVDTIIARGGRFKRFCEETGITWPENQDVDAAFASLDQQYVVGSVDWIVEGALRRDGTANDRVGQINGRVAKWMSWNGNHAEFSIDEEGMQRAEEQSTVVRAAPASPAQGPVGPRAGRGAPVAGRPAGPGARGAVARPPAQGPVAVQPAQPAQVEQPAPATRAATTRPGPRPAAARPGQKRLGGG